ncbi:hypothetical protein GCM10011588_62730 [Nocardia jinanensis]|uniref:Uncharacterized protein n=1 Tax=Nocardia jinanensis TaxID=382504 RepID=A0A917RVE4_9NOCA|nr:hypothetical protein GCM10011588_62730 [Nocardia jinanensis]
MQNDGQDMAAAIRGCQQGTAQRRAHGHIESLCRQVTDPVLDIVGVGGLGCQIETGDHVLGRQHDLDAGSLDGREHGAQCFVPFQHIEQSGPQRGGVELSGQLQHQRDVVCRRGRVDLVDQPYAVLRGRQRDGLVAP